MSFLMTKLQHQKRYRKVRCRKNIILTKTWNPTIMNMHQGSDVFTMQHQVFHTTAIITPIITGTTTINLSTTGLIFIPTLIMVTIMAGAIVIIRAGTITISFISLMPLGTTTTGAGITLIARTTTITATITLIGITTMLIRIIGGIILPIQALMLATMLCSAVVAVRM